jgi:hypothetical protein
MKKTPTNIIKNEYKISIDQIINIFMYISIAKV